MPGIASAATSLVVPHIAAGTRTIRVGAGGIMLPNHSPMVIAEQLGTLEHLFPGRIDLGLGRAPGTDRATLAALRTSIEDAERFPEDVLDLQACLAPAASEAPVQAVPAAGALDLYRSRFKPSEQLARSYAMIGVNVIAAETDAEARRLATTQQMSFTNLLRGRRGVSRAPIDDIETYWTAQERTQARRMLARSIVGAPKTVRAGIDDLVAETGADELIIVSDVYDHAARLRSFELIAER